MVNYDLRKLVEDQEFIEALRQKLHLPDAAVEIGSQPAPGAIPWKRIRAHGLSIVAFVTSSLSVVLIPKDVEDAYSYYSPISSQAKEVVIDFLRKPAQVPGNLPPTKHFVVFGPEAILPPEIPTVPITSTTSTTTTTSPPPSAGVYTGSGDLVLGSVSIKAFATFTPPDITNFVTGPAVIASTALPPDSLNLMQPTSSPVRDLEVWEL